MPRLAGELLGDPVESGGFEVLTAPFAKLEDAFLEGDLRRLRRQGVDRRVISTTDLVAQESAPPAGIILHCGRCGSTLLSRMLGVSDGLLGVREPSVLADALAVDTLSPATPGEIAAMCGWYEEFARERNQSAVLKFTSTASIWAPRVAEALSDSPLWFLVRELDAVVRSCVATPPPWLRFVLGSPLARSRLAAVTELLPPGPLRPASAVAAMWAQGVMTVVQLGDRITWVQYQDLVDSPYEVVTSMARTMGAEPREPLLERLTDLSRIDAKTNMPRRPEARHARLGSEDTEQIRMIADSIRPALIERSLDHLLEKVA